MMYFLGMPRCVMMEDHSRICYTYNSEGRRLRENRFICQGPLSNPVMSMGGTTYGKLPGDTLRGGEMLKYRYILDPTAYCENIVYEMDTLSMVMTDNGYISFNGRNPIYHYFLKDHLGSVRVVMSESGQRRQVNHYYPFGGLTGESSGGGVQRRKYVGKELDRSEGIDLYDVGARQYDAACARFTAMDAECEKYYDVSPYAYCMDNPVNALDMDGRSTWVINKGKGIYEVVGGNINFRCLLHTPTYNKCDWCLRH